MLLNPFAHIPLSCDARHLESFSPGALMEDFFYHISNEMDPVDGAENAAHLRCARRGVALAVESFKCSEHTDVQRLQQPSQPPRHKHDPHAQPTRMGRQRRRNV